MPPFFLENKELFCVMKVRIHPASWQEVPCVQIPPSKSLAHRAILCASLSNGKSTLRNVAYSDDILATISGMCQLGARIETLKDSVTIEGTANYQAPHSTVVDCKESGSTLRFFIPVFTLGGQPVTFLGRNRLLKRPQGVYETIYRERGLRFEQSQQAITVQGSLTPGTYEMDGNISSQFISGLLFALPLLDGDSTIQIRPPFESKSYVELTLQTLELFGVNASFTGPNTLFIPGNQAYRPCDSTVEGDFSQMAFFAVLGAVHGTLECTGMRADSRQGDKVILDLVKRAGAHIETLPQGYRIFQSELSGTQIDLADCPDLGPILMVLAMYAKGETKIVNAGRLRYKESDRISAMETELRKFGVDIQTTQEEIVIRGKDSYCCTEEIDGHTDHRIVMSMAVAGICSGHPVTIRGAECIDKSYPGFFEDLEGLGIRVEVLET